MIILSSMWVVAILAILLGVGTHVFLLISNAKSIFEPLSKIVLKKVEMGKPEKPGFWSFRSWEIEKLVSELSEEKKKIAKEAETLHEIEEYIKSEKATLEESKSQIEALKKEIADDIFSIEHSEEKNLKELAELYANLPAETIVQIFNEMDDTIVLKVLSFMEPGVIAGIFQAMMDSNANPEYSVKRVARLSEMMRTKKDE